MPDLKAAARIVSPAADVGFCEELYSIAVLEKRGSEPSSVYLIVSPLLAVSVTVWLEHLIVGFVQNLRGAQAT